MSPRWPRSATAKLLSDLGVEDTESVHRIVIESGHVVVYGYERDDLDLLRTRGAKPAEWSRVYPVDFDA